MKILITISLIKDLCNNGLNQNIIFLGELLESIGLEVFYVVDHPPSKSLYRSKNITIIEQSDALGLNFNYLIQAGFFLSNQLLHALKQKNKNFKNIHLEYGNRMLGDMSRLSSRYIRSHIYMVDEIWLSPHYESNISYYKSLYRVNNIKIIPYIWSPKFIEGIQLNPNSNNISIMEPNINVSKNCLIPLLISEEFNNQNQSKKLNTNIYCSNNLNKSRFFKSLLLNLDKNNSVHLLDRKPNTIIFSDTKVVVSHQIMNELNYLYLECLYLGIPLIHNSPMIRDAGYYYPEHDTIEGSRQLQLALDSHTSPPSSPVIDRYINTNTNTINEYKTIFGLC